MAALRLVHPIDGTLLTGICLDGNVQGVSGQAQGQIPGFAPNRLKAAAEAQFFTLPSLARELGVSEKSVYRWNAGVNPPRLGTVRRIATLLERDPSWFFEPEPMEQAA